MAIKANVSFKGMLLSDVYVRVDKIVNVGGKIKVQAELYSIVEDEKHEIVFRETYTLANTENGIMTEVYKQLKKQFFPEAVDT